MKRTFQPKKRQRTREHGFLSRMRTRGGRKVYDGGGISPDIATEPQYISRFAVTLLAMGFIEDFVDEYMQEHHTDTIDNRTFSITDADYDAFVKFMEGKEVPYESETRRVLKVLKEAAENDLYSDLAQEITAIEGDLKDDTQTNLHTYRKEIAETINNDIVLRHSYQAGVIEGLAASGIEIDWVAGISIGAVNAALIAGNPPEDARGVAGL